LYLHHIGTSLEGLPVSRWTRSRFKRDEVVISHVARLVEKKGTAFLIRALAEISCKYESRFKLRIAGDGPLLGDLKALASGLGVGDRVTFLGSQTHSEAIATIAESDIFCLPSVSAKDGDAEGLGMVLLEAAAVGTPIVAARSGGITDFVKENETGRLVMPGDVASLARGLMRAEAEPAISLRLAETARVVVEESFDVKRQTAELERRLDTLLDRE
jgi:glycosyltransferase involved in cell wall biosynthesis